MALQITFNGRKTFLKKGDLLHIHNSGKISGQRRFKGGLKDILFDNKTSTEEEFHYPHADKIIPGIIIKNVIETFCDIKLIEKQKINGTNWTVYEVKK